MYSARYRLHIMRCETKKENKMNDTQRNSAGVDYLYDETFHDETKRHAIVRSDIGEVLIRMDDELNITWMNLENSAGKTVYYNMLKNLEVIAEVMPKQLKVLRIRELLIASLASRGMINDPLRGRIFLTEEQKEWKKSLEQNEDGCHNGIL